MKIVGFSLRQTLPFMTENGLYISMKYHRTFVDWVPETLACEMGQEAGVHLPIVRTIRFFEIMESIRLLWNVGEHETPSCFGEGEKYWIFSQLTRMVFCLKGLLAMLSIAATTRKIVNYCLQIIKMVWKLSKFTIERMVILQTSLFGFLKIKKSPLLMLLSLED